MIAMTTSNSTSVKLAVTSCLYFLHDFHRRDKDKDGTFDENLGLMAFGNLGREPLVSSWSSRPSR